MSSERARVMTDDIVQELATNSASDEELALVMY